MGFASDPRKRLFSARNGSAQTKELRSSTIHIHIYIYIHIHIYIYIHIHIYIYTCIYVYIYIYTCIYIYMYAVYTYVYICKNVMHTIYSLIMKKIYPTGLLREAAAMMEPERFGGGFLAEL